EVAKLHDLGLSIVKKLEARQCIIERDQVVCLLGGHEDRFVKRFDVCTTASFLSIAGAGLVDEDATHCLGRDAKEMFSVLERTVSAGKFLVDLVNKRGRIERVVGPLLKSLAVCKCSKLLVDERNEPVQRVLVSTTRQVEQLRNVS